jgi:penicillin-binding protein 1B
VIEAVISVEDERFFSHIGLDFFGIFRALVVNLRAGRVVQGGSTLTQQLVKNLLFSRERSLQRKLLEAFAALSLESRLSKDRILEMYLNEVYLGQEGSVALHGFDAASNAFFGKSVEQLSLPEAATLAGVIQAPSAYSPRRHPARAAERRAVVLRKMRERGIIDDETLYQALRAEVKVLGERFHDRRAPYFVTSVHRTMTAMFGGPSLPATGIRILTGLDLELQECAEESVRASLERLKGPKGTTGSLEVGLVALEPFSGKVRAWVGGRDYRKSQFDHVSQAKRQIGSTIKPFLYLTALDGSLNSYRVATPISILSDEPLQIESAPQRTWEPENFDREFRGDVTLRYALERSLNIPAVQILTRVGIPAFKRTLQAFNLADKIPEVPALALGALDTSLLELTAAFGALANGGVYIAPRTFTAVLNEEHAQIATSEIRERRVAEEAPTFVLTDILRGVIDRGTGSSIRSHGYTGPAAGKTGTSDKTRDAWFVGYTPTLVTGVWLGYDDNRSLGITGGSGAAPLWAEFMKCASAFVAPADFVPPPDVRRVEVDPVSGLRTTPDCPSAQSVAELFVVGTEPPTQCDLETPRGPRYREVLPPPGVPSREAERSLFERLFDW